MFNPETQFLQCTWCMQLPLDVTVSRPTCIPKVSTEVTKIQEDHMQINEVLRVCT